VASVFPAFYGDLAVAVYTSITGVPVKNGRALYLRGKIGQNKEP
jgi:hypothetical protein